MTENEVGINVLIYCIISWNFLVLLKCDIMCNSCIMYLQRRVTPELRYTVPYN